MFNKFHFQHVTTAPIMPPPPTTTIPARHPAQIGGASEQGAPHSLRITPITPPEAPTTAAKQDIFRPRWVLNC